MSGIIALSYCMFYGVRIQEIYFSVVYLLTISLSSAQILNAEPEFS